MKNQKDFSVWEIQDGHGTRLGFYQSPRAALKCVSRGFGVDRSNKLLICTQKLKVRIPRRESTPVKKRPVPFVTGEAFFQVGPREAMALLEQEGQITLKAQQSALKEEIFTVYKRLVY